MDFEPRVIEAMALTTMYRFHAGMDVSDGLALDLSRLAAESGVGAIIDIERVPIHETRIGLPHEMDARRWNTL